MLYVEFSHTKWTFRAVLEAASA